ncbi:cytochrome P450 [Nocardia vaccinii]|uniref:cytochrome P450 n=1 Tax=Nocardia vaccinii TaxID=1822 RepID=UPI000830D5B3|nr:cytochrome P450 [Nocardia vaccinii]
MLTEYPLQSPDFYAGDPFPVYRELRKSSPVHWTEANGGFWSVLRYDDIKYVASHPELFTSTKGVSIPDPAVPDASSPGALIMTDPPRHVAMRKIVSKGFTPKRVADLEGDVRAIVGEILDAADVTTTVEFARDIVAPIPTRIIASILGAPPEDWEQFKAWSDAAVGGADPDITLSVPEASALLFSYFGKLISDRKEEPRKDLISILLAAEIDGEGLSEQELNMFLWLLLIAGNETTRNLISAGTYTLMNHPEQRQMLVDDPSLIPNAVEEMLRFVTPVTHMVRVANERTMLRGKTIEKDQVVVMLYGSANRDEDVFGDNAEEFDITRFPNPHLAFGTGEHSCLGLSLARLEAKVFFEEFLARFPQAVQAGEVTRLRSTMVPGLKTFPVRLAG